MSLSYDDLSETLTTCLKWMEDPSCPKSDSKSGIPFYDSLRVIIDFSPERSPDSQLIALFTSHLAQLIAENPPFYYFVRILDILLRCGTLIDPKEKLDVFRLANEVLKVLTLKKGKTLGIPPKQLLLQTNCTSVKVEEPEIKCEDFMEQEFREEDEELQDDEEEDLEEDLDDLDEEEDLDLREEFHDCHFCEKYFNTWNALKTHEKSLHDILECSQCSETFTGLISLKKHKKSHEEDEEDSSEYFCKLCDVKPKSSKSLECHMKKKHTFVSCDICGQNMAGLKTFDKHFETYHCFTEEKSFTSIEKIDPDKCSDPTHCRICEKDFASPNYLMNHVKFVHRKTDSCCDICGKVFNTKQIMMSHRERHFITQFNCDRCDKTFKSKSSLVTHTKLVHDRKTVVVCHLCGKESPTPTALQAHIDFVHKNKERKFKRYKCGICNEKLMNSRSLNAHYITNHPGQKRYPCELCPYGCDLKSVLTKHMKNTHKIQGEMKYQCGRIDCGMKCWSSHEMRDHYKNVHPGLPKFECPKCGHGANQRQQLARHMRIRHDIQPNSNAPL